MFSSVGVGGRGGVYERGAGGEGGGAGRERRERRKKIVEKEKIMVHFVLETKEIPPPRLASSFTAAINTRPGVHR